MCIRLSFWWLVPLLRLGYNVPLEQSDLSPLPGAEHVKATEPSTGVHEVSQCPENAPTLWSFLLIECVVILGLGHLSAKIIINSLAKTLVGNRGLHRTL